jgi:HK97 family phage portal protein
MAIFDNFPSLFRRNQRKINVINSDTEEKSSAATAAAYEDNNAGGSFMSEPLGMGDLNLREDEDYSRLLRKYSQSAWVYIAVNRICNAVSQVNFRVVDKRKRGRPNDTVVKGQGLVDLLQKPNQWMTDVDFFETLIQHLLLTGNAYIEKAEIDSFGRPHELFLLNPKNMTVVPHKTKYVAGYKYVVNKKIVTFRASEIIHIKLPDPRGESHYGLGTLASARNVIEADWAAREWQAAYFRNATWPSGIIVSNEPISETEFKRMKRELKQNYEGKSKVGKVLVLEGGLDWKQTTPNPKDLDFLNLLRFSREEVLSIFGVPPSIAGIFQFENTTSRSAGVREQSIQFWSNTVQPITNRILAKLNAELSNVFSRNYEIIPDVSEIPSLKETAEIQQNKANAFHTLITSGWSINSALSELYPNHEEFEWGEIPLPSLGLQGEQKPEEQPEEQPEEEPESTEEEPQLDDDDTNIKD